MVASFPEMSTSMNNDFEELLTAKGFKIRDSFRSRDEMIYSDNIKNDFAFLVEIDLQYTWNRTINQTRVLGGLISTTYTYQDNTKREGLFAEILLLRLRQHNRAKKPGRKTLPLIKPSSCVFRIGKVE